VGVYSIKMLCLFMIECGKSLASTDCDEFTRHATSDKSYDIRFTLEWSTQTSRSLEPQDTG
jgi:hypothetical protein